MTLAALYAPLYGYLSTVLIVTGTALWFSRHRVAEFAGTGLCIAGWEGWLKVELSARSGWAWIDGIMLILELLALWRLQRRQP